MKLKLKGETRIKKFKAGSFNKSANNDSTFSNTPKVQKDNTTVDQTVNKFINKKDKSSLGIKLHKVRKPIFKKKISFDNNPTLGRTATGIPKGEEGSGGGTG